MSFSKPHGSGKDLKRFKLKCCCQNLVNTIELMARSGKPLQTILRTIKSHLENICNGKCNKAGYKGTPVADGWAGAIMSKQLAIHKHDVTDRPTDRPTDTASSRVACPRLKMTFSLNKTR